MIAFLSTLGLVVLVIALCHDRQTGKVQIFVREWMPATVDEGVRVTFTRTEP